MLLSKSCKRARQRIPDSPGSDRNVLDCVCGPLSYKFFRIKISFKLRQMLLTEAYSIFWQILALETLLVSLQNSKESWCCQCSDILSSEIFPWVISSIPLSHLSSRSELALCCFSIDAGANFLEDSTFETCVLRSIQECSLNQTIISVPQLIDTRPHLVNVIAFIELMNAKNIRNYTLVSDYLWIWTYPIQWSNLLLRGINTRAWKLSSRIIVHNSAQCYT